eukprot:GHVT01077976.1.p1 GENE.GHVT01077976.1~~GHVT01077976.1.p1  ORF type:complete len:257 (-),score=7.41 GHVT01077976.1:711-1481(-)
MTRNDENKSLVLIGAPLSLGRRHGMGVAMAPQTFRQAGLVTVCQSLGWNVTDDGDVACSDITGKETKGDTQVSGPAPSLINSTVDAEKYFTNIIGCESIGRSSQRLFERTCKPDRSKFVLTLGGDHSIGFATVAGARIRNPATRIVWVDAHADSNTPETSTTHNYHGMPVAHLMGWFAKLAPGFEYFTHMLPFLSPCEIVFIGLRDICPLEKELLRKYNIRCYSVKHIDAAVSIRKPTSLDVTRYKLSLWSRLAEL